MDPISFLVSRLIQKSLARRRDCVERAVAQQGMRERFDQLAAVVDDEQIRKQYTTVTAEALAHPYWVTKIRAQHVFQIGVVEMAIEKLGLTGKELTLVDIGDSAGTHIQYLRELLPVARSLSVNLDPQAVEKITARGLEARCCRAEELAAYDIQPDLYLSFQMIEHLPDPIGFFRRLATKGAGRGMVFTVPYQRASRVALHYIRYQIREKQTPEDVHIFELSLQDWELLLAFCGWRVVASRVYYQYPATGIYSFSKSYWRTGDYEGFLGLVLERDETWSELYDDGE